MDNLLITIRDFHIRYEDVTSNPSTPFTFGVLLESFTIETTDEQGRKLFVDRSNAPPAKMHKVATLKNLTVYWDRLSKATSLQKSKNFETSMRNVIYSDFRQLDRRWLLLPPCSLSVRFTKNESQVFTKECPKYRIQATVTTLALHLSREQYDEMVFMYLAMRSRLAIEAHFWYNRHRPFLSITNYSIVWWDYAVRFYSKKKKLRFRWSVVRKMARDRKMYIALYKQHHLQHIPLSAEQLAYLQRLDDMFPLELTMRLRDMADAQLAKTKTEAQAAAAQSSWFGYFFGEGDSSKDVQEVLSAEGKADLKRAFDETVALEEAPVPEDCCIVVVDLTLQKGEIGLFAYKNVPLLTSEFTGSCLFQVQPASRWLLQLQLRRLNVLNWRCANTDAAGRKFCALQVDHGRSATTNAPFEISVAATDVAAMRVRVSADPIRVVLDPVFLLQLMDFFSTNDTLNDVWEYATSSVQNYVFAEQEADMRAVVATKKHIMYDVLVDMKAPLFVLPEDATSNTTAMLVLDLGRFHVQDVATTPARAADVYSWQFDMTEIEVLLQQPKASNVVPIVPRFNVAFAVESSKNFQDSRIPFVSAKASMPSVIVNGAQDTIMSLGKLHASLLKQCKAYCNASSVSVHVADDVVPASAAQRDETLENDLTTKSDVDSCVLHLVWLIEFVQVNIDDTFRFNMRGTWFDYQARSSSTTVQARLQDLSMEDRCHAAQSPYYYLARTEDSSDLIQVTLATSTSPARVADTTVDVQFNVLHMQWNPSSIMMLYTMIAAYGSSMDGSTTTDLSASIMSQSTTLATPTNATIPSLKVTAALKKFSVSFNKDELDRRLLTVTVANASLGYIGHQSGLFSVQGELGDVTGVDFSVKKAPTYSPFFGMDRSVEGSKSSVAKLLQFEYDVTGGATMPRLSLVLNSIRIVYFHQQILELVDYLFQGILGSLVNQTLLSATQLLLEPAASVVLDIRIEQPKILVPMEPMDVEHFLLTSSRLTLTHVPSTFAAYADSMLAVVRTRDNARSEFACDLKHVVLEHAGLYSSNGSGGYDDLMAKPMTLSISIIDVRSTHLEHDGKALPRFSIDCLMPHMHLKISRKHYLMFFRVLGENIGGDSLVSSAAAAIHQTDTGSNRPVVVYEYANADLEAATMALSFLMESFSCALDIGLALETTNLTVCLNLLHHVNPLLHVSLANASVSNVMRCDSIMTIKYEWDDEAGTTFLDVAFSHLHGKLIPHVLSDVSRFFALESNDGAPGATTAAVMAIPAPNRQTSFTMNMVATNVQLSLPQDLQVDHGVEFVVAANFDVAFESFTNHIEHLQQKLTLRASDCEALLQNANRQGCSDTLVQLIEPTTMGVTYLGFEPCPGHHQDKIDVSVSPIEVFLSYEDSRVLADVWATMQCDMQTSASPPSNATLTRSSSKPLQLASDRVVDVQRHITCEVASMQLTLINDCDGCDMGLLQLELPMCRVFMNATTTNDATTATGGCDLSFASSYYNPDSRVWHPLCPEWKLAASVMTNIPHVVKEDQLNSMQWHISADTLKLTATHGLLEALASAGGSLMKAKETTDDASLKHAAPCLIQNESGMPIEYWWSSDPRKKTRVEHKGADAIHYVHVKGKGAGVTRTYTSSDKEHGTLCINLLGMDTMPVQGESNLTKALHGRAVTCDTQLVGGHIVLTISSHLRVQSHLSNEIQLLVYDPTWKSPVELGNLRPLASTYIPIAYSTGSELRVRLNGPDWAYSSPIPIDAASTSTITVTCVHESSKVAVFCVALDNGVIELYEPYVLENKLPVSVMFQVKDAQSLPRGDDVVVGCKSAIWWCRSTPVFAFNVPGCETTNWLPLLRKRDGDTFSLTLKRLDRQPLTILVAISENKAKAVTITLLAEMWIINKTGVELLYGNDADDVYVPQARSVIGATNITLYSTPSALRFRMGLSNWTTRFKADPKRMNWQDECLAVTTSQGRLYEFGVSADYGTRHFGVLTTLVSITPRYVVVNRTPWTLVLLEDDGSLQTMDQVDHVINAGDAYSLWWAGGSRKALRASVVSVKTGGLSQATFVVDIARLDSEPDLEQSKWDVISYDIKVAGLDITLSDSTQSANDAFDLFGSSAMAEDVARFSISNIRFDSFKDRISTNSHLDIASVTLEDLLEGTKYPKVLTPSKAGYDFVQFTYVSKRHPKYAYIEELTLWVKDVHLQTSMKFVDRINTVVAEVSTHFATTPVDLLTYFTAFDSMEMTAITGRKCFFERCHIHPINVVVSFVRDKNDRIDPSAGFWISNLKFRIKDASIVLDEYKLSHAFATQESVVHAVGAFYVSSMKGQALNLIESIQVTSLVTGVVKDGVSSLVSTLIGKTDTSLASSASFRYESLSNQAIVAKHSAALAKRCTSPADVAVILNHLVYDWDGNHTGLEARACMALGIVNNSRQSVVLQVFLKDGAETRLLPTGRNYLDGASTQHWTSDRALIVFAWGYTPTLLTTGDICLQLQSNAFNLYISKNSTRLQPNPGYSATFTVQEKQTWWSKFMIIVGDDLPSQEVSSTDAIDTYEVMFTTDALGIVAKQVDHQTVVVRECCYFSNGQPGPALATGRISEDDVILSVNGIPIKSTQAFKDIIVNTSRPIVVRFKKASFDLFGETPRRGPSGGEYSLFG
ncbi:hypothetical protein DYB32_000989 [Aphanomyces invadans]|uniref:Vacuolar protein sorting-associated protein 13 VPS13 adaptor binding domain-containing protein n=1 Tax=Aphanomyces invadans TaxID=157072 RepID=A0A418B872_9STRA|nr:hypothetical protein DYB32_000989 [Aphanomyces invadans]